MKRGLVWVGMAALLAGLPLAGTGAAMAKPLMVSATPAAGATATRVSQIVLGFDAPLLAGSAGAEIVMTGMPGMANHAPMVIKAFTTSISEDGKTLTLALRKPLVAGTYTVRWSAMGADKSGDGVRGMGTLDFSVE